MWPALALIRVGLTLIQSVRWHLWGIHEDEQPRLERVCCRLGCWVSHIWDGAWIGARGSGMCFPTGPLWLGMSGPDSLGASAVDLEHLWMTANNIAWLAELSSQWWDNSWNTDFWFGLERVGKWQPVMSPPTTHSSRGIWKVPGGDPRKEEGKVCDAF